MDSWQEKASPHQAAPQRSGEGDARVQGHLGNPRATLYQAQATVGERACSLQRKFSLPLCGGRVVSVKGREAEHVAYAQDKPLLMSLLRPRTEARRGLGDA